MALSGCPFPSQGPCCRDPAPAAVTPPLAALPVNGTAHSCPWRPACVPWLVSPGERPGPLRVVSCVGVSSVSAARAAPGRGRPHPVNRRRGGHFGSCCASEQECAATSILYKSRGHTFLCLPGAQTSGNRTAGPPGDPSCLPGRARRGGCLCEAPGSTA